MRETTRRNQKRGLSMSGWLIAFCVALLVMLGLVLVFLIEISLKITSLHRRLAQIAEENSTRHEKQADIAFGIESELKWIRRTLIP
jgi:cell division protein FtsB